MKILIATCTYPPNADGVAEASKVLAQGLADRGHEVTVATEFHPHRTANTPGENPRVEQFKISGTANLRVGVTGETKAYQDFLLNYSGDVVVFECWDAWSTCVAEPVLGKLTAKKVLVSHGYCMHLWNVQPHFPWGIGYWMGGWPFVLKTPRLMRRFDHLVILSQQRRFDRFLDHWIAKATGFRNYSIIPNGAFAEEFTRTLPDFRSAYGVGPGPMLLNVANYCDRKDQARAVRAFRHARLEGATLVLIGSEFNDYSRELEHLDAELQRDCPAGRVLMLEKLTREQTCSAYQAADLFLLSAKAETQPIVLIEAMASHTPFLSTDVGCVRELPGGLVAKSEDDLVKKMKALIHAREWRQRLADEGWAASQQTYDWVQVVSAYERLLMELCAGTKSRLNGAM